MDNRWNTPWVCTPGRESSRARLAVFPQLMVFAGDRGRDHSSTNT